jgi:hypothetical protein
MAPSPEKRRLRLQTKTKTKRGFTGTVPDWTVAEEDDDKYDVHIMRRRSVRHRLRRRDISSTPVKESEVLVSILHDEPSATQPVSTSTPTPTPTTTNAVKAYESGSDSDSQSGDESMSDDEKEESDDEKESDPVPTGQPIGDKDVPYKVKLPASATETPAVEAPSAEGSIEEAMVSSISSTRMVWRRFRLKKHVICIESLGLLTHIKRFPEVRASTQTFIRSSWVWDQLVSYYYT